MDLTQALIYGGPVFIIALVLGLIGGMHLMEKADHRDQATDEH